ncbi:MAG: hypothetical protein HKN23_13030 [Verrucomicrobiales bacterium]|nr:hypothetical protein [Verrucomicrobiales bacterium]
MRAILEKYPRWIPIVAVILVFGLIRTPIEKSLRSQLIETHLLQPPPARTTLGALKQSSLMGMLGGLRSMVAVYLTLKAYEHFGVMEWDEVESTYDLITSLEPREEFHWVHRIWHRGINAVASVEVNDDLTPAERQRRFDLYSTQAIEIGEAALEQLPNSVKIREQMAEVYREKLRDYCGAAKMYGEMKDLPGAMQYSTRFYGYFLAKCPGNEQKAYDHLYGLYVETMSNLDRKGERGFVDHRAPTLIITLKELEEKLDIPISQRIPDPHPDEGLKRRNRPTGRLPGGVGIP